MYATDLKDETFDLNNSRQYQLLLQFSNMSFAYAVFDNNRNKFVLLRNKIFPENNFSEKFKNYIEKDETLNLEYQSVKAILLSQKSIFVPKALFDKEKTKEILSFNTKLENSEEVLYNQINNDIFNVFAFNKKLYNQITEAFNKIKNYNQGTVLLKNNLNKKNQNQNKIIVDTTHEFFEIIFLKNNELVYRNTFKYTNETDFVFYLISVIDKFNFDSENDELNISGIITIKSKETDLLKKYIKKIRFIRTQENYSYVFNDIEINIFTNLLNLKNCE